MKILNITDNISRNSRKAVLHDFNKNDLQLSSNNSFVEYILVETAIEFDIY